MDLGPITGCVIPADSKGEHRVMHDEFPSRDDPSGEVRVRRLPSPGVAAVLAVLIPGLGHVYVGRLLAGAVWFLAISLAY